MIIPILLMLLGSAVALQANNPAAGELLRQGDAAYQKMDNKTALESYLKALAVDSTHYEAHWKAARAYVDVGEMLPDKADRKKHYASGRAHAERAIAIKPEGSKGYLFLSVALGRVALDAGARERVRLSKEIRIAAEKALEYDPQDDIAWHVLGRWHRKVATLSWIEKKFANLFLGGVPEDASVKTAAECLEKATRFNPGGVNHFLELGITYEMLDLNDKAIAAYQTAADLPALRANDVGFKQQAAEKLKKLR